MKRLFSIVGPFALAIAPLAGAYAFGMLPSNPEAPIWPDSVVAMRAAGTTQTLEALMLYEPAANRVTAYPTNLVVTPPAHGELRALTLFNAGKIDEIRAGLETAVGQPMPFYLVYDGFGTAIQHNLGEQLDTVTRALEQTTAIDAPVRHVRRPDGTYAELLRGTSMTHISGSLPQIDPSRVFVRILFRAAERPDAQLISARLEEVGFNVLREEVDLGLSPGVQFQYRFDPELAEVVAQTAQMEVTVEPITDISLAARADVLILVG